MNTIHKSLTPAEQYSGDERRNEERKNIDYSQPFSPKLLEIKDGVQRRLAFLIKTPDFRNNPEENKIREEIISHSGIKTLFPETLSVYEKAGCLVTYHQSPADKTGVAMTDKIFQKIRINELAGFVKITKIPGVKLHAIESKSPEDIDYDTLTFESNPENSKVMGLAYFHSNKDGGAGWSSGIIIPPSNIEVNAMAQTLNYGSGYFESSKVFYNPKNDEISLFRLDANARRAANSAKALTLPPIPEDLFIDLVKDVVLGNAEYQKYIVENGLENEVELYIRVTVSSIGAHHGIRPYPSVDGKFNTPNDTFLAEVTVVPVKNIFGNIGEGLSAKIFNNKIRVGRGMRGDAKNSGWYGQTYEAELQGKKGGFNTVVYFKSMEKEDNDIGECKAAALIFEDKNGVIRTPSQADKTILPSVTLDSLLKIARAMEIPVRNTEEIKESDLTNMVRAAFVGTAAVATPWKKVEDGKGKKHEFETITEASNLGKIINCLKSLRRGGVLDERVRPFLNEWLMPIGKIDD